MNQPANDTDVGKLLRVDDICTQLDCSRGTIYRLARSGRLEMVKFGRTVRITERSYKRFINILMSQKDEEGLQHDAAAK